MTVMFGLSAENQMATGTEQPNFQTALLVRWFLCSGVVAVLVTAAILLATATADARITKIQIISRGPAFEGFSFPGVGPYERIVGKGFGEISPTDRHNNVIVDIGLAPRNAAGKVEYSFDFYILKPTDLSRGNHKVFYEAPNRGVSFLAISIDRPAAMTPRLGDPAGTFLAPQGYTMVWSGWDFGAGRDNSDFNLTITLTMAKNPDGSSITGPAYEYIVVASPADFYPLNYTAATLDKTKATLTHRVHLDDVPQAFPASGWEYRTMATRSGCFPRGNIVAE